MKPMKRIKKEKFHACERALVKQLEQRINRKYPDIYTQIDTDSKARVFKSGWDIMFAAKGKAIFCECKHVEKPPVTVEGAVKLLSNFQKLTRLKILKSVSPYWIVIFFGDAKFSHVCLNSPSGLVHITTGELMEYIIERLNA